MGPQLFLGILVLSFSVGLVEGLEADSGPGPSRVRNWGPGAHPGVPEHSPLITIQGGLLTVRTHGAPLRRVLQEIAQRSGFRIFMDESIATTVEAEFEKRPLEEGLRRLLRGYDYILLYRRDERSSATSLSAIRVYPPPAAGPPRQEPKVRSAQAQPVDSTKSAGRPLQELARKALEAPDPATRKRAVEALGDTQDEKVLAPLLKSLRDNDPEVRLSALEALLGVGTSTDTLDTLPLEPLHEAARHDADPRVRRAALEVLTATVEETKDTNTLSVLKDASHDPDAEVRDRAGELLAELSSSPRAEARTPAAAVKAARKPGPRGP